jgi:hypothetical protein
MSTTLIPLSSDEEERVDTAGLDTLDERVAARVQRVADDARVSTFERRGHAPRRGDRRNEYFVQWRQTATRGTRRDATVRAQLIVWPTCKLDAAL